MQRCLAILQAQPYTDIAISAISVAECLLWTPVMHFAPWRNYLLTHPELPFLPIGRIPISLVSGGDDPSLSSGSLPKRKEALSYTSANLWLCTWARSLGGETHEELHIRISMKRLHRKEDSSEAVVPIIRGWWSASTCECANVAPFEFPPLPTYYDTFLFFPQFSLSARSLSLSSIGAIPHLEHVSDVPAARKELVNTTAMKGNYRNHS